MHLFAIPLSQTAAVDTCLVRLQLNSPGEDTINLTALVIMGHMGHFGRKWQLILSFRLENWGCPQWGTNPNYCCHGWLKNTNWARQNNNSSCNTSYTHLVGWVFECFHLCWVPLSFCTKVLCPPQSSDKYSKKASAREQIYLRSAYLSTFQQWSFCAWMLTLISVDLHMRVAILCLIATKIQSVWAREQLVLHNHYNYEMVWWDNNCCSDQSL